MPTLRIAVLVSAIALTPLTLAAQHQHGGTDKHKEAGAPAGGEKKHAANWKEMDAFHTLLAATYHPAADARDLAPLRSKGDALAAAAEAWASAKRPAACTSDEIVAAIALIAKESRALAQRLSANAPDAELTTAIGALHDRFEAVEKKCGAHAGMKGMKHG